MIQKAGMTLFFRAADPLSNWHMADFEVKGVRFSCVEQYMMYCKAKIFGDDRIAGEILSAAHPREHKALGREVLGYQEDVWGQKRMSMVYQGCLAKFTQNERLKRALLATGDTTLVEASPYDLIWGVGLSQDDSRILNERNWRGQNLLGVVLSKVRNEIKNGVLIQGE